MRKQVNDVWATMQNLAVALARRDDLPMLVKIGAGFSRMEVRITGVDFPQVVVTANAGGVCIIEVCDEGECMKLVTGKSCTFPPINLRLSRQR